VPAVRGHEADVAAGEAEALTAHDQLEDAVEDDEQLRRLGVRVRAAAVRQIVEPVLVAAPRQDGGADALGLDRRLARELGDVATGRRLDDMRGHARLLSSLSA
jgi:hypothetical protein